MIDKMDFTPNLLIWQALLSGTGALGGMPSRDTVEESNGPRTQWRNRQKPKWNRPKHLKHTKKNTKISRTTISKIMSWQCLTIETMSWQCPTMTIWHDDHVTMSRSWQDARSVRERWIFIAWYCMFMHLCYRREFGRFELSWISLNLLKPIQLSWFVFESVWFILTWCIFGSPRSHGRCLSMSSCKCRPRQKDLTPSCSITRD